MSPAASLTPTPTRSFLSARQGVSAAALARSPKEPRGKQLPLGNGAHSSRIELRPVPAPRVARWAAPRTVVGAGGALAALGRTWRSSIILAGAVCRRATSGRLAVAQRSLVAAARPRGALLRLAETVSARLEMGASPVSSGHSSAASPSGGTGRVPARIGPGLREGDRQSARGRDLVYVKTRDSLR